MIIAIMIILINIIVLLFSPAHLKKNLYHSGYTYLHWLWKLLNFY